MPDPSTPFGSAQDKPLRDHRAEAINVSPCGEVHHHLRNGIMAIMGHLSVLLQSSLPAEQTELDGIRQQIFRMERALSGCNHLGERP